jgi:hypothetical protein
MPEGARFVNATSKTRAGAQAAFTMQRLWRQAVWGCIAAAAVLLAVLAAFTDIGSQRAALVFGASNAAPPAPYPQTAQTSQAIAQPTTPAASRSLDADYLVRQLTQTVRGLADDRDRMMKRLAAIERNVDDMTGSISQQIEAVKAASTPPAVPWLNTASMAPIAAPETSLPAGWESTPRPSSTAPTDAQTPPDAAAIPADAAAAPANAAYGAEIGSAASIKALHARWAGIRSAHLQILDGLTPVVALRENPRSHKTELRLVVGPLANAAAAAQLCASLTAVRLSCLPTMFDGHNLALE